MPLLKIQTSITVNNETLEMLSSQAAKLLAEALGKEEKGCMILVEPRVDICFKGSVEPAGFLEISSIGFPNNSVHLLASSLTKLLQDLLKIDPDRVYIKFYDIERGMWALGEKVL